MRRSLTCFTAAALGLGAGLAVLQHGPRPGAPTPSLHGPRVAAIVADHTEPDRAGSARSTTRRSPSPHATARADSRTILPTNPAATVRGTLVLDRDGSPLSDARLIPIASAESETAIHSNPHGRFDAPSPGPVAHFALEHPDVATCTLRLPVANGDDLGRIPVPEGTRPDLRVTSPDGTPVLGCEVTLLARGRDRGGLVRSRDRWSAVSDRDGLLDYAGRLRLGEWSVLVDADHELRSSRVLRIDADSGAQHLDIVVALTSGNPSWSGTVRTQGRVQRPLAGVRIRAVDPALPAGPSTRSAVDGRFTLRSSTATESATTARVGGLSGYDEVLVSLPGGGGRDIDIALPEATATLSLRLRRAGGGRPVGDVQARWRTESGLTRGDATATPGADDRLDLADLPDQPLVVTIIPADATLRTAEIHCRPDGHERVVELHEVPRLTLRVRDEGDRPVPDATATSTHGEIHAADEDGRIDLPHRDAPRVLELRAPGHATTTVTINRSLDQLTVVLQAAATLRGRLTAIPPSVEQVHAIPAAVAHSATTHRLPPRAVRPGPDGRFEIDLLPAGPQQLVARVRHRFGTRLVPLGRCALAAGRTTHWIGSAEACAAASLAGTVHGVSGVSELWLIWHREAGPSQCRPLICAPDGSFLVDRLPPGRFTVRGPSTSATEFVVLVAGEQREARFDLSPGELRVTLLDSRGGPRPGRSLAIRTHDGRVLATGTTDPAGEIRWRGIPRAGELELTAVEWRIPPRPGDRLIACREKTRFRALRQLAASRSANERLTVVTSR